FDHKINISFFFQLYSPLCALADVRTLLHASLSNSLLLHPRTPNFRRSFSIPSIHPSISTSVFLFFLLHLVSVV
ncbi:hypothetical protein L9F63_019370, partial [Diploptera punctata]